MAKALSLHFVVNDLKLKFGLKLHVLVQKLGIIAQNLTQNGKINHPTKKTNT